MLSTLFKGRNPLASARADKRLGAIEALTPEKAEKLRDRLADCARQDTDRRVRLAALVWVDDRGLLERLLDDADVADAAAARLATLGASTDHPAVRRAQMRAATSAQAALEAVSAATTAEETAALFVSCPGAFRETLLPRVRAFGESGLSALERESRNRDKQVNRIARAELDDLRGSNRAVEELRARAEELEAALARESADASPARSHQLQRALAECIRGIRDREPTLARYGLTIPNLNEWQAAVDAASVSEAGDDETATTTSKPANEKSSGNRLRSFDALVAELRALDERLLAGEPPAGLKPMHDELAGDWLAQADRAQPDNDQKALFEAVSQRYREMGGRCRPLAEHPVPAGRDSGRRR